MFKNSVPITENILFLSQRQDEWDADQSFYYDLSCVGVFALCGTGLSCQRFRGT